MIDTLRFQPVTDTPDFFAGLGPQAVIDAQRRHPAGVAIGPARRQNCQAQAVGAAGNGDGEMGPGFERSQIRHQVIENVIVQRREGFIGQTGIGKTGIGKTGRHHGQLFFRFSRVTVLRIPAEIFGKSLVNLSNAAQASRFLSKPANDIPSFNNESGAFGPFGSA